MPDEPLSQTLASILLQNVRKKGIKIFSDGFEELDRLRALAKENGIEVTDDQMVSIKKALVRSVRTRRQVP